MENGWLIARGVLGVMSLTSSAFLFVTGCGDVNTYELDPSHIDASHIGDDHACFDGSEVELFRYSAACAGTSNSLVSIIRDGIVFSSEEVRQLGSPCAEGPAPAVDISFNMASHSIVLDFSPVVQADRFPETGFDGYVFDIGLQETNGTLVAMAVDRDRSTILLDDRDLEFDHSRIELNLEGVRYDHDSLLKIDLVIARMSPPQL